MHVLQRRCNPRVLTLTRLYSEQINLHNQHIIDFLKTCQNDEEIRPDANSYKVTSYKHAIQQISKVDLPIRLGKDIGNLPGVGPGIMRKINEFLYASESMQNQHPELRRELQKARAIKMLQDIPGIGPTTAKKLFDAGCNSIDELPKFVSMLNRKQKAKYTFMGHTEQTVQREDAEDVLNFCRQSLDPKYEITLVGEHRREIFPLSQIRLMISHPEFIYVPIPSDPSLLTETAKPRPKRRKTPEQKQSTLLQSDILPSLRQRGLIAETITSTETSWDGIIRLPEQRGAWGDRTERVARIKNLEGRFRRTTIHFVSHKCRGASLLTLTGDTVFWKDLQRQARQSGMLLDQYGLWKWNPSASIPSDDDAEDNEAPEKQKGYWSLVKSCTEEEIFEELGIDFVEPAKRNYSFISTGRRRPQGVGRL